MEWDLDEFNKEFDNPDFMLRTIRNDPYVILEDSSSIEKAEKQKVLDILVEKSADRLLNDFLEKELELNVFNKDVCNKLKEEKEYIAILIENLGEEGYMNIPKDLLSKILNSAIERAQIYINSENAIQRKRNQFARKKYKPVKFKPNEFYKEKNQNREQI